MALIVNLAFVVVIVRCAYVTIELLKKSKKDWLNIVFYISIVIIALSMIF